MLDLSKHCHAPAYSFFVGDVPCCIISDGTLDLGPPEKVFLGETKRKVEQVLTSNIVPTDRIVVEQNILFFSLGGTNVLVETGVGSFRGFGERAGKLVDNVFATGIDPARIDAILYSHPHLDHVGVLCQAASLPSPMLMLTDVVESDVVANYDAGLVLGLVHALALIGLDELGGGDELSP